MAFLRLEKFARRQAGSTELLQKPTKSSAAWWFSQI